MMVVTMKPELLSRQGLVQQHDQQETQEDIHGNNGDVSAGSHYWRLALGATMRSRRKQRGLQN